MEVINKIIGYLTFKKDTGEGSFLKSMHVINKISILMFLMAMVMLVVKLTRQFVGIDFVIQNNNNRITQNVYNLNNFSNGWQLVRSEPNKI